MILACLTTRHFSFFPRAKSQIAQSDNGSAVAVEPEENNGSSRLSFKPGTGKETGLFQPV